MTTNVIPLKTRPEAFAARARSIAQDSSKVLLNQAMANNPDGVTLGQIWHVIERGTFSFGPVLNEHRHVYAEMRAITAGDEVYVALVMERGEILRILHAEKGG